MRNHSGKRHILWAFAIAMALILAPLPPVGTYSFADGDGSYTWTDGTSGISWVYVCDGTDTIISGCSNIPESGVVRVPSEIGGRTITVIGARVFKGNADIKEVYIPNTVSVVSNEVFMNCASLQKVKLPDGIEGLGMDLFRGCSSLSDITIPGSVTVIANRVFSGCSSLKNISIPASVEMIAEIDSQFSECTSLERFEVDAENSFFCEMDGVLFDKRGTELLKYPQAKEGDHYDLPQSVTKLSDQAFSGAHFKTVGLVSEIESIPSGCFQGASELTEVTVPEGVTEIGAYAFANTSSLKKLVLPDSLKTIGSNVLNGSALKELDIPSGVTNISETAFSQSAILRIKLPGGLEKVEDYLFNQSAAKEIIIPSSVVSMGRNPFRQTGALECIYIPASVTQIDVGNGGSDDLFYGTNANVKVYVQDGSYIQSYLKSHEVLNDSNIIVVASLEEYLAIAEEHFASSGSGDDPGSGTGDTPGDTPGGGTIDPPGDTPGDDPGSGTGGTPGSGTGGTPGSGTVDDPGNTHSGGSTVVPPTATGKTKPKAKKKKSILTRPKLSAKNKRGRMVKLTWSKVRNADGYLIYVKGPADKKFVCRLKESARVKSITHKGLLKGKKYRYKVVPYKKVKGKTVKGPASKIKTVRVKK